MDLHGTVFHSAANKCHAVSATRHKFFPAFRLARPASQDRPGFLNIPTRNLLRDSCRVPVMRAPDGQPDATSNNAGIDLSWIPFVETRCSISVHTPGHTRHRSEEHTSELQSR